MMAFLKDDSYAPGKKSYTGYTVAQAEVNTGNVVDFFLYQDSSALDNYPIWEKADAKLDSLTIKPKAAVNMTVMGYCIGYYGCVPMEALEANKQVSRAGRRPAGLGQCGKRRADGHQRRCGGKGRYSVLYRSGDGWYILSDGYMPEEGQLRDAYCSRHPAGHGGCERGGRRPS